MGSSSDEESDFSDSEINEYKKKPLQLLKTGSLKVKYPNGAFRCPFCAGKKKQDYLYNHLYQHAIGVAKGSSNRSAKQKASHLALAEYMEIYLAGDAEPVSQCEALQVPSTVADLKQNELFCWPCVGIIANILKSDSDSVDSPEYWFKKFAKYKPCEIELFWDRNQHSAHAVVRFDNDWTGFKKAMEFEKGFEADGRGKKEWKAGRNPSSSHIYGWFACKDDYYTEGAVGEYLRRTGVLKAFSDLVNEGNKDQNKAVVNLVNEFDVKNENLDQLQVKYNERTLSVSRVLEEKDEHYRGFREEIRKMQRMARESIQRIFYEQDKLNLEVESKKKQLDLWSKELDKNAALVERERLKLEEEKTKNNSRNSALQMDTEERKKAIENMPRVLEEQKLENEEARKKISELTRNLGEAQKLEMEAVELKGKLEVMEHLRGDDVAALQQKLVEMKKQLQEKTDDIDNMEESTNMSLLKDRQSNDELQDSRKELILGLQDMLSSTRVNNIGIKKMGEIDEKVFRNVCKTKFPASEAEVQALELCSLWQEKFKNPAWHPFRIVEDENGNHKKVLVENDENLARLKAEWGDEIYHAVTTALFDLHEYNASGCYAVPELWNFKENRRASHKEVVHFMYDQMKSLKRKREVNRQTTSRLRRTFPGP